MRTLALTEATAADDAGIRALLRESPLGGAIRIALTREPDARLAAGIEGDRHQTFVVRQDARDAVASTGSEGKVIGMGTRSVRDVWLNGEPARLGYLGMLRRGAELTVPGRRLLAEGFALCDATRRADELPYDLTSVVADNLRARRLLERGLPGFPRYRRRGDFTTMVIPATRRPGSRRPRRDVQSARDADLAAIVDCLQRNLRRYQFAPRWTEHDLRSPVRCRGLRVEDFLIVKDGSRITACLARWDQRRFKQAVVHGYSSGLGRWRPLVNVALALAGHPRLPAPGSQLDLVYLSHVAIDDDDPDVLIDLVRSARLPGAGRRADKLILGLAADNPMRAAVEGAFPLRAYASVLYSVHHRREEPAESRPDHRPLHVEVATL